MKKIILYLLISINIFASVSKYEITSFLGKKVYFPKKISKYISDLLEDKDTESYYEIAKIYAEIGEKDASINFLEEYKKLYPSEYKKISKIYHKLGDYDNEIKYLDKYIEEKAEKKELLDLYMYIVDLIQNNNLAIDMSKYSLNKFQKLELYSYDSQKYYEFFLNNEWNTEEKHKLVEIIKNKDFENDEYLKAILLKIATPKEISELAYAKIKSLENQDGYYEYFLYEEKLAKPTGFRNDLEKLYYLKYKKSEDFNKEFKRLENRYIKEKDIDSLYKLYFLNEDFKIMYNLSFNNEDMFYKFFNYRLQNEISDKDIVNLISFYENNDEFKGKYKKEMLKHKLNYVAENEEKIKIIDDYINKTFDKELFLMKIDLLLKSQKSYEAETLLAEKIFKGFENKEFIQKYIEILENSNRIDELISKLKELYNKKYYIDYAIKYGFEIDKAFENDLIQYYFEKGEYVKLLMYKDKLNFNQLDYLLKNGWQEYLDTALEKYECQKDWIIPNELKYFYFNKDNIVFDNYYVSEIERKTEKTDVEIYYLYLYYKNRGNEEESEKYYQTLKRNYLL
ncbi:MAG: hypothetical protein PWP46_43 [Fusobacteriaceae bacterium]|jgi:hypothetical protein|nr:hypothetical protein [Fusobacteriales bacterium]MDN5303164.1 hypothetical protein [Fusobacteriaceae bacterium]